MIITGRDRDEGGYIEEKTINATSDLEALLYVIKNYDLPITDYFNDPESYDEEGIKEILDKVNSNDDQAVELIKNLYFETLDVSDYYDMIVSLKSPSGEIIIKDDVDLSYFQDEDDEDEDW